MKKTILGVVIGIILTCGVAYASNILTSADNISYSSEYTDKTNVADALDELLSKPVKNIFSTLDVKVDLESFKGQNVEVKLIQNGDEYVEYVEHGTLGNVLEDDGFYHAYIKVTSLGKYSVSSTKDEKTIKAVTEVTSFGDTFDVYVFSNSLYENGVFNIPMSIHMILPARYASDGTSYRAYNSPIDISDEKCTIKAAASNTSYIYTTTLLTDDVIDISHYSKLKIIVDSSTITYNTNSTPFYLFLTDSAQDYYTMDPSTYWPKHNEQQTYEIDLSNTTGNKYIGVLLYNGWSAHELTTTFSKIWLEI